MLVMNPAYRSDIIPPLPGLALGTIIKVAVALLPLSFVNGVLAHESGLAVVILLHYAVHIPSRINTWD